MCTNSKSLKVYTIISCVARAGLAMGGRYVVVPALPDIAGLVSFLLQYKYYIAGYG